MHQRWAGSSSRVNRWKEAVPAFRAASYIYAGGLAASLGHPGPPSMLPLSGELDMRHRGGLGEL